MVDRFVLKELELTEKERVKWREVSRKVTSFEKDREETNDKLGRTVVISEEQSAVSGTAPRKNELRKDEKHGRGSESICGASSRKASMPRVSIEEKVKNVEAL